MLNRGCSEEKQMPAITPVDSVASPKKLGTFSKSHVPVENWDHGWQRFDIIRC